MAECFVILAQHVSYSIRHKNDPELKPAAAVRSPVWKPHSVLMCLIHAKVLQKCYVSFGSFIAVEDMIRENEIYRHGLDNSQEALIGWR